MRILSALGAAALSLLVVVPALAATTTIDFTEISFPGSTLNASNEYAADGVLFSNAYYYVDSRDPFDGRGIANGDLEDVTAPTQIGRIDFVGGTTNVFSFDWWTLFGALDVKAYDAGDNLLDSLLGVTGSGSNTLTGPAISYVTWNDGGGFVQLSTISYDLEAIPLPATLPLLAGAIGLCGLAAARRRRAA